MITTRTLQQWRRDALLGRIDISGPTIVPESLNATILLIDNLNERILRLTQELLDVRLLEKGRKS